MGKASRQKHRDCAQTIRGMMAKLGCEVAVGTAPPLVANPYIEAIRCPHGTTFYFEPTGEQIADWAARGVE